MTARLPRAAALAAAGMVVAACASPGYPYRAGSSPPPPSLSAPPAHAQPSSKPASYLGVYEPGVPASYAHVDAFAKAVRRQPNLALYFSGWGERFMASFAGKARARGAVPMIDMNPYGVSMRSVAAGRSDGYLRSYALAVRSYGHPVVISFAHEMNGNWYPWGWTRASPKEWIRAWRHVVTLFRRSGADNVAWLWSVNGVTTGEGPIRDWWPGAAYVTWVGMDAYYTQPAQNFASLFGPTIAALRKITHKPLLVAETGVGPLAGQAAKIPNLFAGIRAHHLLGFVWFDRAQNSGLYHQNWRIDNVPAALAAFRRAARHYG
jgi:mannan endo-1,4-beta-mannosidase